MYSTQSTLRRTFDFIPVIITWGIIYINTSCFTSYYALSAHMVKNYWQILLCCIFYFCAIMTLICHTISMCADPGTLNYKEVRKLKEKSFCKKCNKDRPIRTHHCSNCNICVLKLDHHCPWIYNCVGFHNQKTFFLFLLYGTIGDCISAVILILRIFHPSYVQMILKPKRPFHRDGHVVMEILKSLADPIWIIVGFCLSMAMTLGIGGLLLRQVYLLMNNMTNVETSVYEENAHCSFYAREYKDKWFMFKTVMGLGPKWKCLFPIKEENKYNAGYTFDTPYIRPKDFIKPKTKKCCDKHRDGQAGSDEECDPSTKSHTKGPLGFLSRCCQKHKPKPVKDTKKDTKDNSKKSK